MMIPVFHGLNFSYMYEEETGHYLLFDNDYSKSVYLQGDDARIFRKEIERIDILKDPENKTGLLTEHAIEQYL